MSKRAGRPKTVVPPSSNPKPELVAITLSRKRKLETELAQLLESIAACDRLIAGYSGAQTVWRPVKDAAGSDLCSAR